MNRSRYSLALAAVLGLLMPVRPAGAESETVAAGKTLTLDADRVLRRDDVLEVLGTAEAPCNIVGNGHAIRSEGNWTGRLRLSHAVIKGLGTEKQDGIRVAASGKGDISIEGCTFDACSSVSINNADSSTAKFRNNVVLENSLVPVTNLPSESRAFFTAGGASKARKLFQGNRIHKSWCEFTGANWLIGGDTDAEGNILIGVRTSIHVYRCADTVVRGNYVHVEIPSFKWSQVANLAVVAPCPNLVVEHNIFRHGQWVVRGLAGQFRYNLVLDADAHNWIIGPAAGTHIHHNIFARYCTIDPNLNSGIGVIYKGDDIQIYNNTFDGGGKDLQRVWHAPAIEVGPDAVLASLRNNVFFRFPTKWYWGTATIRPGFQEKIADPRPARLGYADFNLFHNPDAEVRRNYAVAVAGKAERMDAGFAKNDVPAGGAKDEQEDPKFAGPIPTAFPFSDEDMKFRKATVSQVLAHYRKAYTPAAGSPVIDAGDPADGPGADIGAVGAGKPHAADLFGRFRKEDRPKD